MIGRALDDVEGRQRRRKLAFLRTSCKNALWFAETFGIDLLSISFQASEDPITFQYSSNTAPLQSSAVSSPHSTVIPNEVLYLLDRFGVSDEFYHELSMLFPFLHRSYMVKEAWRVLVGQTNIQRLPKPYYGCYQPFKEYLTYVISTYDVGNRCFFYISDIYMHGGPVEVKISGDGAPFSRLSSYIHFLFLLFKNLFPVLVSTHIHVHA